LQNHIVHGSIDRFRRDSVDVAKGQTEQTTERLSSDHGVGAATYLPKFWAKEAESWSASSMAWFSMEMSPSFSVSVPTVPEAVD
jgi:hypothetical protein